ncbi:MAG: WD40 repeat domain-containing protein, partial [Planctomycetia bacterium]
WNPADGKLQGRLPSRSERIHALQFSPDGKTLLSAGGVPGQYGEVVLWDAEAKMEARTLVKTEDVVFTATFSPDGKQVAAGGSDRLFRIWDAATGAEQHKVENHADWILAVAFSPDGKRLFTASRDKSAKIWDQTTKEPVLTFPQHTDGVYGIGVAADGKTAASAGADNQLRLWQTDGDGKQTAAVAAAGNSVYALVFAKSGKILFTAGGDNLLKAWNPANAQALRNYPGHTDWVYSIALSADEKTVASGAWNGEVRVFEVESAKPLANFVAVPALAAPPPAPAAPPPAAPAEPKK